MSSHQAPPAEIDVTALYHGRPGNKSAKPFRGRPLIADDLSQAIELCAKKSRPQRNTVLTMYQDVIFFLWFLDEMEDATEAQGSTFPTLNSVWQIPGQIWNLYTEWLKGHAIGRAFFVYGACKRVFTLAAQARNPNSLQFYLPPNPFKDPQKIRNSGGNSRSDEMELAPAELRVLTAALRSQMQLTEERFSKAQRHLKGEQILDVPADLSAAKWSERLSAVDREISLIEAEVEANNGFYPRNLTGLEVYRRAGFDRSKPLWRCPSRNLMRSRVRQFVERMKHKVIYIFPENDTYEWHFWATNLDALHQLGCEKGWSVARMHAGSGTYFQVGSAVPATVRQIVEGLHAFVPRENDILAAIALLLFLTGWNLSTVLDMDATDWWRPHPTHPDILAQLFAPKMRSRGALQYAFSLKHKSYRPFDIVQRVLKWTEPLRLSLKERIAVLEQLLAADPSNHQLQVEHVKLCSMVKRVWLFLNMDGQISSVAKQGFYWTWVHLLFQKTDVRLDGKPVKFTQSLTRKSFAVFVYETSGYNLFITQVALGHKDFSSLLAYLDRKRIRTSNRRAWFRLQVEVIKGLESGALISGVLAKKMRLGSISEREIRALEQRSDRTRQGFACADPMNPDRAADPEHRKGELCREQRCLTGCSKAFATWDTAQWLALYILELRRRRDQIPVPLWHECDDDIDLRIAEDLLGCYSQANQKRAFDWAEQKLAGRPILVTLPGTAALRAAGLAR